VAFTGFDADLLPKSATARTGLDALDREFPPHRGSPINARPSRRRARPRPRYAALATEVRRLPGVAAVARPPLGAAIWQVTRSRAPGRGRRRASDWSRRPRSAHLAARCRPGADRRFVDQQASLGEHLPLALVLLAATTAAGAVREMTGSVVLPVKGAG